MLIRRLTTNHLNEEDKKKKERKNAPWQKYTMCAQHSDWEPLSTQNIFGYLFFTHTHTHAQRTLNTHTHIFEFRWTLSNQKRNRNKITHFFDAKEMCLFCFYERFVLGEMTHERWAHAANINGLETRKNGESGRQRERQRGERTDWKRITGLDENLSNAHTHTHTGNRVLLFLLFPS